MSQQIHISVQEAEDLYGAGTYFKRRVVIVRGDGARLWDEAMKSRVIGAVAKGDLSQAMASEIESPPVEGAFQGTATVV
jgi:hypothetical protein